jgi:hypothetical protein
MRLVGRDREAPVEELGDDGGVDRRDACTKLVLEIPMKGAGRAWQRDGHVAACVRPDLAAEGERTVAIGFAVGSHASERARSRQRSS